MRRRLLWVCCAALAPAGAVAAAAPGDAGSPAHRRAGLVDVHRCAPGVRVMERHGFSNYHREWWHFDHRVKGPRYLDLSLGCDR